MSAARISFERLAVACAACGATVPAEPAAPLRLALTAPPAELPLCTACRTRIEEDGARPEPFAPVFEFDGAFRLPIATDDDLAASLRAVAATAPTPDAALRALLERSAHPKLADHEAWVARLARPAHRPDPLDVAGLLTTGAFLDLEPESLDSLQRLVARAAGPDELAVCFAAWCARLARVEQWRPDTSPPGGRSQRLLEQADRQILFAALPSSHPLAERARMLRAGAALVLGKGTTVDDLLTRSDRDAPRTQLMRGLRFAQLGNHSAADREFRAAVDNPFAGFDPMIGAASIWNRTVRALAATRWSEAKDALRAYCRLRPTDARARIVLGHAYVQCSMDNFAREVLASALHAEALAHLRGCAEDSGLDSPDRAEGALLYATCLMRLGATDDARRIVDAELASGDASRRPLLHRLAARVALATDRPDVALDHLESAWPSDPSPATAHEVVFAFAAAARTVLELHGLSGLFTFVERRAGVAAALRKHYGALHALLLASFALHQVRNEFRAQHGFGLEWSWIGARGASAQTSTFQAYGCLARHQVATAVAQDLLAVAAGGAAIPFALLSRLLDAARRATPDERERLQALLANVAQWALRELGV